MVPAVAKVLLPEAPSFISSIRGSGGAAVSGCSYSPPPGFPSVLWTGGRPDEVAEPAIWSQRGPEKPAWHTQRPTPARSYSHSPFAQTHAAAGVRHWFPGFVQPVRSHTCAEHEVKQANI